MLTAINKGFPKNLANVFILLISPKYAVQSKEVDFEMPLPFKLKYWSHLNRLYASCSFAYYESNWCWRSLALDELCLLGHKIIRNPLWDILATGVAVYWIKLTIQLGAGRWIGSFTIYHPSFNSSLRSSHIWFSYIQYFRRKLVEKLKLD